MANINELRKKRFQLLHRLYELSGGDKIKSQNELTLGNELGFSRDETETITQYLEGERLIEYTCFGGGIAITHYGLKEVEDALSKPEQETRYFPPINVINIHHMENSQIQQGNTHSNQTGNFQVSNNDIESFIALLKGKVSELQLNTEDHSEIDAEISTIESQLSSSRPKKSILSECLGSIRRILEGASGKIVATQLLKYIPRS